MDKKSKHNTFTLMRKRAEELLNKRGTEPPEGKEQLDIIRLSHELEIYQTEIDLQNEELERTNKELEQSRNEFFDLYQSAPVGFVQLNKRGLIERINKAARRMLGGNPDYLIGSSFAMKVFYEDQNVYFRHLKNLVLNNESGSCELRLVNENDGESFFVKLEAAPKLQKGKLSRWHLVFVDISDRKLAEETLRQTVQTLKAEIEKRKKAQSKLQQLTRKTIAAMEHDRRKLSKEIHDSIGGSLAAIKMQLESSFSQMPTECTASLQTIIGNLTDLMIESRRISHQMRPMALDDFGLKEAISTHIRKFANRYPDIQIDMQVKLLPDEISDEISTVVYRVVQEALNNIGKHSKADFAQLNLTDSRDHILSLKIEDNGIGFDKFTNMNFDRPLQGYGLLSMKERVEICGGTFEVESSPGKGTRIFASIPKNP